ncbi:DUF5667 domain-containing protein [Nocardioides sp. TRM66260-LWL]|uniref:DUF5667 domain-containing protein n=1 Tax=Nocardioides sp. TRM66260-LWL TaxID=2874478 RepID=UPI001CC7AF37|nr:DUF5667 domain-containing protein [Nocardioides sp. TRM66260-LWL]MBZ5734788.1 DUF5667 domain-containing protein [Nocardioides sp. TRM66260-LWL]
MSPVLPSQRRAEAFAALVDAPSAAPAERHRDADLLALTASLRAVAPVEARPEFVGSLRERLLAAAATELVPLAPEPSVADRLTVAPRRSARDRRLAAAVGGLAIIGGTASMAMASESALPGDVLYPVKRVIEDTRATVASGDDAKGEVLLRNAAERLSELDALTAAGADPDDIRSTLSDFNAQTSEASSLLMSPAGGVDDAELETLRTFAAQSLSLLDQLASAIPVDARDALVSAGSLLTGIDTQASQACTTCTGPGIVDVPRWLAQGAQQAADALGALVPEPRTSTTPVDAPPARPSRPASSTPARPESGSSTGGGLSLPTSGAEAPTSPGLPTSAPTRDPIREGLGQLLGVKPSSTTGSTPRPSATSKPLQGVVDGVNELLDPDADGTLGGLPTRR